MTRQPRRRLTRERIIEAAFVAWGRALFVKTSLNLVARELGVTKPALYRHFRSKEDLLAAMEADYAERLREYVTEPFRNFDAPADCSSAAELLAARAEAYIRAVFSLFEDYPYHYLFYVRNLMKRSRQAAGPASQAIREHDAVLVAAIDGCGPALPEPTLLMAARYAAAAAAFWTTDHYRREMGPPVATREFRPETVRLTAAERATVIDRGARHIARGFMPTTPDLDWEAVERIAWIRSDEIPERHYVLTAITETVLDVGYSAATIERIAEHAGLSKSGLYHYFRNRDDMLAQTLIDAQQHFAGLARIRFGQLGTHAERLYGLFVMIASYARHDPSSLIVENWLRESNIEVHISPDHFVEFQRIYAFVSEMLVAGQLAGDPDNGFAVLTFITFLVMQELDAIDITTLRTDRLVERVRALFRIFATGVIPILETDGVTP